MIKNKSKNLFDESFAGTLTVNGITIQSFGNGEFLINGTPTIDTRIGLVNELNYQTSVVNIVANTNNFTIKNGINYKTNFLVVSGTVTNPSSSSLNLLNSSANFINIFRLNSTELLNQLSNSTSAYFYIFLSSVSTFTNYRVRFQIEEGDTRTAYIPYNDIQVSVGQFEQGQGKNLFDGVALLNADFIRSNDVYILTNNNETTTNKIIFNNLLPNTQYTLRYTAVKNNVGISAFQYDGITANGQNVFSTTPTTFTKMFTTQSDGIININMFHDSTAIITTISNLQLELGNTATAYEPYSYLAIHNPASNDIPIPALNNKTLNEVFVGGVQFQYNNTSVNDRLLFNHDNIAVQTFDFTQGIGIYTSTNTNSFYGYTSQFLENLDTYYLSFEIKTLQNVTSISAGFSQGTRKSISNPPINQFLYYNHKGSPTNRRIDWIVSGSQIGDIIHINSVYIYNLSLLGLTSITQQDLDNYYQAWQRNNAGTLLANTFIQHDQNSVPIADLNGKTLDEVFDRSILTDITALPNGVKYYEVSGGNIVQRLQEYTLLNTDIININTDFVNTDRAVIQLPSNADWTFTLRDRAYFNTILLRTNITPDSVDSIGKWDAFFSTLGQLLVYYAKGITLAQAKTNLTGEQLLYRLATPITIVSGVSITQAQLDFWYSVWQQNHKLGMRVHRASGNDIPLAVLNNQSLNQVFTSYTSGTVLTLTQSQTDYLYQVWQFNQVNALVARQFIQEA
jgi:hypothetical protein